jgi:2-polyprenyl-6-methoxyphenol hydroxylase-like FAD-dependent oxidoreductase
MTVASTRPVIVVGAGPVGQTCALLLACWGLPVVLLDSRAQRDPVGSKAICQQRDVLDVWDRVGAGRRIADEGLTWTRARTFYRDDEVFSHEFTDSGFSPFPPFVNISQSRTEQVLDERVAAQPLIDLRWGHEVVGIDQDDEGVRVTCRAGADTVWLEASHVVACAGARGDAIRAMLGVTFDGRTFDDQFLICDIRADLPGWAAERRFYFDPSWNPGRQVLIHPCPDSTFRIDWQVPDGFDLAAEERSGALDTRIRAIIGDRPYEIVWRSVYRFHSRSADRYQVGRVLLAGDAAHLVAPFGARGLNSGALDAENAAWKLAYVRNGWAPESLLTTYHDERHAAALENLEITGATMRFLVPQGERERAHRLEILGSAMTDPAARAAVDSGRLAEPYWYVDSPLTTPDASRPFGGRPPRGQYPDPAPGVIIPDCPITVADPGVSRLRQLVREGITALLADGVDPDAVRAAAAGCPAPVAVHRMAELSPRLASLLRAGAGEVWLIRPDAHIAAVTGPAGLSAALGQMLGLATSPALQDR